MKGRGWKGRAIARGRNACEEDKVTGGGIIAKVAGSTSAPLTLKSCVLLGPVSLVSELLEI